MKIYFKDSYVEDTAPLISVHDRSFRFGDGVFETVLVANGKLFDWPRHAKRLQDGLEFFGIDIKIDNAPAIAAELIKQNQLTEGYVRIIISRGDNAGGLGYKPANPNPYMVVQTIKTSLPQFKTSRVIVSSTKAFYHLPCKVNSALHYVMALAEAAKNNADNALLLNNEGYICETATSNIFWVKGAELFTPSTDLPFVPGTMRSKVIELWNGKVTEGKFKLEDLQNADEIFLSNVGLIISPVSELGGIKPAKQEAAKKLYDKLVAAIKA